MPPVSPDALVVVTGITGYIGSLIGLACLNAGLRVRGTVRSAEKGEELRAAFEKQGADGSKFEYKILDSITDAAQYEAAFQGTEGVIHVALDGGNPDLAQSILDSDLAIVHAAHKVPTIKRIVFTSSSVASRDGNTVVPQTLTGDDYNEAGLKQYQALGKEKATWKDKYAAGKTMADKAVKAFVEENKPSFDTVIIMPNTNFGPMIYGKPHSTAGWVYNLLNGNGDVIKDWPPQWCLDTRDDARAHAQALLSPDVGGKRFWVVAAPAGWNQILGILRKHFPDRPVPADVPGEYGEIDKQKIDNSIATKLVGTWIPLEQSLVDTAKAFGF